MNDTMHISSDCTRQPHHALRLAEPTGAICGLHSRTIARRIALKVSFSPPRATAAVINSRQVETSAASTPCDRRRRDSIALYGHRSVCGDHTAQAAFAAPGLPGHAPAAGYTAPASTRKRMRRRLLISLKYNRDSSIIRNNPAFPNPQNPSHTNEF